MEFQAEELIQRAKNYPFDIPHNSYIFVNGLAFDLLKIDFNSPANSIIRVNNRRLSLKEYSKEISSTLDFSERLPVLAYGSNASSEQLRLKFSDFAEDVVIPVIKANLFDFDVVYSAHISPYGSVPATLQYSPETVVKIFVLYLTEQQLERMHEMESLGVNYFFCKLLDIRLVLENLTLNEIYSYLSLHNCLFVNGTHIAISSIKAENRVFPEMSESEVLVLVRDFTDKEKDLRTFILENITNPEIRRKRIEKLHMVSKEFLYKRYEVVAGATGGDCEQI